MSKFFKIFGFITLIATIFISILLLRSKDTTFWGFFYTLLTGIVSGLALLAIGDLMDRVDALENSDPLNEEKKPEEDKIQQRTCPNCGKLYDIDSPKCPYCGYKNETL